MSKYSPDYGDNFPTLVDILRWRADWQPDQLVHTFLVDGETKEVQMTYGQLDRQARAIAARLQSLGATGERALLIYPSGLEFITAFFGCLYAGVIAIPVYPPHPARLAQTLPTLRAITKDAQPLLALTTSPLLAMANMMFAKDPDFRATRWVATDAISSDLAEDWQTPALSRNSFAFLQFTSGSTAMPKGVMISHGNLLHNLKVAHQAGGTSDHIRAVLWLPFYHDLGLFTGVFSPVYRGFPVTLMSPLMFLQRPLRWLQAISRTRATHSGGPNFAYDFCVRKITPEQRKTLDLSSWEVAFNGAEPVRLETLERFAAAFEPCGFRKDAFLHCYGLAEITVGVSWSSSETFPIVHTVNKAALAENKVVPASGSENNSISFVGCGKAPMDYQIIVVDPESKTRGPSNQIGEIWISSPSVGQGYWNRPKESAQTFGAYLTDSQEGPFLRTGDLGFLVDGELFVTGRIKDLLVIRGKNYYPQDIELIVEKSHPALRLGCGAAFSIEVDNEERLVVVQEIKRNYLNIEEIIRAIRRTVIEQYGLKLVAVSLLKARTIPKTSSGKIRRRACRNGFLNRSLDIVGEWPIR